MNTKSNTGEVPLHKAAKNGYAEMIKVLIEVGAKVNEKNECGETPLYKAASKGQIREKILLLINLSSGLASKEKLQKAPLYF